jgi:DNA-binding CsgD family transcriptional regulator
MDRSAQEDRTFRELVRLCHAGLDARTLRHQVLRQLQTVVPIDAAFFATLDPTTLLFTSVVVDDLLAPASLRFLHNEFQEPDVNKFVQLAHVRHPARGLEQATAGHWQQSPRFREILAPLGLGDELRTVLRAGGACWGAMCLHRASSAPSFAAREAAFLERVSPHLAEGLRTALLLDELSGSSLEVAPAAGVLLLADDFTLMATTPAADAWLAELAPVDWPPRLELPQVIYEVAARLQAIEQAAESTMAESTRLAPARARLRTRTGHWLVVHAARLTSGGGAGPLAVVLEEARAPEIEPLLMAAFGLTPREAEIARLVSQGRSTAEIAEALTISVYTVQDHLKAIFDKTGTRSRGELVAHLFAQHYLPQISSGASPSVQGGFHSPTLDRIS